jgi:hypothetical protein
MDQYNWHLFKIGIRVLADQFDKEALTADLKDNVPHDPHYWGWSFGSSSEPGKQHADMMLDFRREKYVRITITYHRTDFDVEDIRPLYMEDCAKWLGGFIKEATVAVNLEVTYVFENGYASVINLPFPLLAVLPDREFEGASVTGLAIQMPSDQRVTIDRNDDTIYLTLTMKETLNLKEFQLEQGLEGLSPIVNQLIKTTRVAS